jgi:16S rRNA (adenine1518-N6/adenine1519-N6)-dimethyltransferase
VRAIKRLGQHFLEPVWVTKLISAIAPRSSDTFLEIGPGRGALTRPLAAAAGRVVAFEIDRVLAEELRGAALPRVRVVGADFLQVGTNQVEEEIRREPIPDVSCTPGSRLRVAGNLPYNVAAPILFKLVDLFVEGLPLVDATVMLQREVADRLLAKPGSKDYGVLSVLIGHWASFERILSLPPGAFRPVPKVYSSVVRLTFHPAQPPARDELGFRRLTQALFSRRRKTLANALLAYPPSARFGPSEVLARTGIDGRRRPGTLTIPEFVRLSDVYGMGSDRGQTAV